MSCIFCDIVNKTVPADIILENDEVMAFQDVHPKAPVHVLIVPKKHVVSVNEFTEEDAPSIVALMMTAPKVAEAIGVKDGYKIAFNVGRKGGQLIDHVHMHLLAWPDSPEGKKEVAPI
ncbi:MAG: HIT domain-containing protein [Candidatus Azambacteria bacterium]|nr:HIT domain-containing protein [Candidatus Azambacteria bacterium]